ncbi:hypothetical protein [Loigolactobacillus coryniformis]|uniref:hypothetical protein n=1 Tax=Loigolactobacillus coryniformis TaxID=1610 RepID=UPI00031FAB70|nr:hypothetical protein [Loigolactobacillus coryniformis]
MSFLEFSVFFVAWTYAVWGHLGLDAKSVRKQNFVPTRQQNKVINNWVRDANNDKKAA